MKNIAVFTSGGDSPGMNACIRATVRTAIANGCTAYGIKRGYQGMIDGDIIELNRSAVGNIIQRGGTILQSDRSEEFRTKEGRVKAYESLKKYDIDGVVAIGGDGTFRGIREFCSEFDVKMIGVPGTIDNDLYGTYNTIGYDTAMNTVIEAADKIRDTASSHNRLFFVEVMGRDAGFIALRSAIAIGAEAVLIPETTTYIDHLINKLRAGIRQKKTSSIIIVAEGDDAGGAYKVAKEVKSKLNHYDTRVAVLGHIQRGGSPSVLDRVLASSLGYAAVKCLLEGKSEIMVGMHENDVIETPIEKAIKHNKGIDRSLLELLDILSI